jgi:hypothetical protein
MRKALIVAAVVGLLAAGCSSPSKQLIGKWDGKLAMAADTSAPKTAGDQFAQSLMKGLANIGNSTLEFKPDNTFTLVLFVSMEGTYEVQGNKVILHATKVAGMPANNSGSDAKLNNNKPMTLILSSDGKTLTTENDSTSNSQSGYTYTKEAG